MHKDLAERIYVLEAKDEIRRLMAAYVQARDSGNSSIDDYFTDDAVWEGVDAQVRRRWPHLADNILAPRSAATRSSNGLPGHFRPCCTCSAMSRSP